jgi:Terminase-like family.
MSWDQGEWKPNKKQAAFIALPYTIKEALLGGGAGSGKSDVLLIYGIMHKWHENPLFKQVFMRRTYPDLKKEILGRSREIYSKFGATFNKTDMLWTFPRPDQYGAGIMGNAGAQIFLSHCEEEKDVHNFDSMEISLFTPDELTNCTEYIYLYIGFERNRSPVGSGLPSIIRAAGMPGGIGHTFVKKRFIDPYPEGGKIIVGKGGNKRIYIHATLEDNREHLDPTYAQSLDGRPEAERKAKKLGDWSAYLGQVFDEFRDKKYPDEPNNALHVIEPFDIPTWWPKFVIGDWGFAAMTYIGFYAVSPQKRVYLYREIYWTKTKIEEWAPIVKDFIERDNARTVKFCQSAGQNRGQEHTIEQQISTALDRPIELSVNSAGSRIAGKMLLHEYLRWKKKPVVPPSEMPIYSEEKAAWIMRNKSLEEYKSYLAMFTPPEEEVNIPRLQIFRCKEENHDGHPNCCPVMIESIKACSYDKKSKDGKPAEDVAEFEGDDPYDDLRYALDSAEKYFDEANDEFKRVVREATIINQLQNTGDFTAFYRNMRSVESSEQVMPVRRFHRGRRLA